MTVTTHPERARLTWLDVLWLAFVAGLALLNPIFEIHKQLTLLCIGLFQILEPSIFARVTPSRRGMYGIIVKILLATLLIAHTGTIPIESSYYLIYYWPVISAAMMFEAPATLLWTAVASAAYCSYLLPALSEFRLTAGGAQELGIRVLFFFLVAVVVNRFVTESRRQSERYRALAEALAGTNRQLEQAQAEVRRSERLAALGQLSAGLAHEIRNPLAVIKGSAEMLSGKSEPAPTLARELAGYIVGEVDRLNGIVTRFLDFARPLRVELRPEPVTAVVDRALKAVHDRWPGALVKVERRYAERLPQGMLDSDLCEQVFTNLIVNAYEAMAPAGGELRVTMTPALRQGRRGIEVDLQDTGPGVPGDLREQIFNPFFTTKKSGVGLGLSLVSKIVDEHGGSIRVSGEAGTGACFSVFLPAADEASPGTEEGVLAATNQPQPLKNHG